MRTTGPAVAQVRHLLKGNDAEQSLKTGDSSLPRPEDATEALLCFARAYRYYLGNRYGQASDGIEELISLRPDSSFAYVLSASNAAERKDFDLADQHYHKAIALNPEAAELKFYYAQSFSERQPDKAIEMLEDLWQLDELKPSAAAIMYNILSERGEFQRAAELLTEALELNPRNAVLWMGMAGCQLQSADPDEGIESLSKVVELLPERGPFRGQLAHTLEKAGRLDEAEKHFRELLNIEPKNPVVHLWLARFLGKHRPEARDEALKEARIALELPRSKGLPREKIQQVIEELQSETRPAP